MDASCDYDDMAMQQRKLLDLAKTQLQSLNTCIQEIELFIQRLSSKASQMNGLPALVRNLKREQKTLQSLVSTLNRSLLDTDEDTLKLQARKLDNAIPITNRAITQWDILKRCRSFVATKQIFQGSSKEDRKRKMAETRVPSAEKEQMHRLWKEQGRVEVDVVDNGHEWIAVKALSRDRLAREMTDGGWGWGDHERGDTVDREEWEDTSLAKMVIKLVAAARMNRCEYQFPRVRVVLPNFVRGEEEFDVLLEQLTKIDPLVEVIIDDAKGEFLSTPPPDLDTAIKNLLGNELSGLTSTLNMDHTLLIDLISDLTHVKLEAQPWQAPTTRSQIEEENSYEGGLMAHTLYPLLEGRKLVCTMEAAEHFHEVLKTVGTRTEKERGRLLVPVDERTKSMNKEELRTAFQKLSIHKLPESIQLPVTILSSPWTLSSIESAVSSGALPAVALEVARRSDWKSAKLSIFMYGWASGHVTLTSNKEIRAQVRTLVEEHRRSVDERGPGIWRMGVTRNLLAKHATPRGETDDEGDD